MKGNFDNCHRVTAKWEGGWVNDKYDPGGETKYGISRRAYPNVDIANLTYAQAKAIYKRDYWDAVSGDDLPAGLDLIAFDGAVNSGVSRGAKWLQAAVGATQDGRIGRETVAMAGLAATSTAIERACSMRLAFLRGLKTWDRYGRGWTNRVNDIEAEAKKMIGALPYAPAPIPVQNVTSGWDAIIKAIKALFGK